MRDKPRGRLRAVGERLDDREARRRGERPNRVRGEIVERQRLRRERLARPRLPGLLFAPLGRVGDVGAQLRQADAAERRLVDAHVRGARRPRRGRRARLGLPALEAVGERGDRGGEVWPTQPAEAVQRGRRAREDVRAQLRPIAIRAHARLDRAPHRHRVRAASCERRRRAPAHGRAAQEVLRLGAAARATVSNGTSSPRFQGINWLCLKKLRGLRIAPP